MIHLARIELATFSMSGIAPMQQFRLVGAISDSLSRHEEALRSARRGSKPFAVAHVVFQYCLAICVQEAALWTVSKKTSEIVQTNINCWTTTMAVNLSCDACHIFRDVSLTR